eukprot:347674-Pelagomonas_calceolata.AAC.2
MPALISVKKAESFSLGRDMPCKLLLASSQLHPHGERLVSKVKSTPAKRLRVYTWQDVPIGHLSSTTHRQTLRKQSLSPNFVDRPIGSPN